MPTINQLVRKGRKAKGKKSTAPALQWTFNSFNQRRTRQPKGAPQNVALYTSKNNDAKETELCIA